MSEYFTWTAEATSVVDTVLWAAIAALGISAGITGLWLLIRRARDVSAFIEAAFNAPRVRLVIEATGLPSWAKPAPPLPDGLFARAGDVVVCDGFRQHPICTFVETVGIGDIFNPFALENWSQPKPELGQIVGEFGLTCDVCGGSWWLGGNHFHFKDGWR